MNRRNFLTTIIGSIAAALLPLSVMANRRQPARTATRATVVMAAGDKLDRAAVAAFLVLAGNPAARVLVVTNKDEEAADLISRLHRLIRSGEARRRYKVQGEIDLVRTNGRHRLFLTTNNNHFDASIAAFGVESFSYHGMRCDVLIIDGSIDTSFAPIQRAFDVGWMTRVVAGGLVIYV